MGTAGDGLAAIIAKAPEEPLELVPAEGAQVFVNRHILYPAKIMPELRPYKNRARIGVGGRGWLVVFLRTQPSEQHPQCLSRRLVLSILLFLPLAG
mgnify:CR=1 FL=1